MEAGGDEQSMELEDLRLAIEECSAAALVEKVEKPLFQMHLNNGNTETRTGDAFECFKFSNEGGENDHQRSGKTAYTVK